MTSAVYDGLPHSEIETGRVKDNIAGACSSIQGQRQRPSLPFRQVSNTRQPINQPTTLHATPPCMKPVRPIAISMVLSPVWQSASSLVVQAMATTIRRQPSARGFHGRVVARILPPGYDESGEMRRKFIKQKIDPSVLVPGTGPWHYRPAKPTIENDGDGNNIMATDKQCTTIHVILYGDDGNNNNSSSTATQHPISFELNRDSQECVEKTMKRLVRSLSKHLASKNQNSSSNNNNSNPTSSDTANNNNGIKSKPRPPTFPLELDSSIWKLNKDTMEVQEEWREAMLQTNQDFWPLVKRTPAIVYCEVEEVEADLILQCNPPTIWGVKTFQAFDRHLYVGVPIVLDFDLLFCDNVDVTWFVNDKMVQQGPSLGYVPTQNDLGGKLSVLIRPWRPTHDGFGCEEAYTFSNCIEGPPENYLLTLRPRWTRERDAISRQHLRVLTYNILADQNALWGTDIVARTYESYVEPWILRKQRRMPLILQEILAYQADLVCLQEVDKSVFLDLLEPSMRFCGYEGFYSGKGGDDTNEGCAMFWSLNRFDSLPHSARETHYLRDSMPLPAIPNDNCDSDGTHKDSNGDWPSIKTVARLLRQRPDLDIVVSNILGHVVQMAPLVLRDSGRRIWVCNTHLYFHPMASHIRTLQMFALCRRLGENLEERPGAAIICGDFNANLTDPAGRILIERHVPANAKYLKLDLNRFSWDGRGLLETYDTDFPELRLPDDEKLFPLMRSALSEDGPVTHFIKFFQGRLDHIVVGGAGLEPVGNAPMPQLRDLGRHTAMPSEFLPSDHVSLVAELKIGDGEQDMN